MTTRKSSEPELSAMTAPRTVMSLKVAGGGHELCRLLVEEDEASEREIDIELFSTSRYAYETEIERSMVDLMSNIQECGQSSVSIKAARWMAYCALRDAIGYRMIPSELPPHLDELSGVWCNPLVPFSASLVDSIPALLSSSSSRDLSPSSDSLADLLGVGLSCALISTYRPSRGCRAIASYMRAGGKIEEGIGLVRMNDETLGRRDQSLLAANMVRSMMPRNHGERNQEANRSEEANGNGTTQRIHPTMTTQFSNVERLQSSSRDTGVLAARKLLSTVEEATTDAKDDLCILWNHTETLDNVEQDWSYNAIARRRFDSGYADHLLFNGPTGLWIEYPQILGPGTTDVLCLPGSFNPLHPGHLRMVYAAQKTFLCHVPDGSEMIEGSTASRGTITTLFEISMDRYGKSSDVINSISSPDVINRVRVFQQMHLSILFTRAKMYASKAALFKNILTNQRGAHRSLIGLWFVVGFDTLVRIADCCPTLASFIEELEEMNNNQMIKVRYLVCPRWGQDDPELFLQSRYGQDLLWPKQLEYIKDHVRLICDDHFKPNDMSSSAIRASGQVIRADDE